MNLDSVEVIKELFKICDGPYDTVTISEELYNRIKFIAITSDSFKFTEVQHTDENDKFVYDFLVFIINEFKVNKVEPFVDWIRFIKNGSTYTFEELMKEFKTKRTIRNHSMTMSIHDKIIELNRNGFDVKFERWSFNGPPGIETNTRLSLRYHANGAVKIENTSFLTPDIMRNEQVVIRELDKLYREMKSNCFAGLSEAEN